MQINIDIYHSIDSPSWSMIPNDRTVEIWIILYVRISVHCIVKAVYDISKSRFAASVLFIEYQKLSDPWNNSAMVYAAKRSMFLQKFVCSNWNIQDIKVQKVSR